MPVMCINQCRMMWITAMPHLVAFSSLLSSLLHILVCPCIVRHTLHHSHPWYCPGWHGMVGQLPPLCWNMFGPALHNMGYRHEGKFPTYAWPNQAHGRLSVQGVTDGDPCPSKYCVAVCLCAALVHATDTHKCPMHPAAAGGDGDLFHVKETSTSLLDVMTFGMLTPRER